MKTIASLYVTVMLSASILFISATAGHGPWYAQTGKWPLCILGAAAMAVPGFLLIALPLFAWFHRAKRELSTVVALGLGAAIGVVIAALPAWIRGGGIVPSVVVAGALGGGAGMVTYARFRLTPLTRRVVSGALIAASAAFVWSLVWSVWEQRGWSSPDWPTVLFGPLFFVLASSWFVFPLGGLLGVWLPRLVERLRAGASFACGSVLGVLVGCAALVVAFAPVVLHTVGSGIGGQQLEMVQSSVLHRALGYAATMIPLAAVWVGVWAVRSSGGLSHDGAASHAL
jgi:hypothetical protein